MLALPCLKMDKWNTFFFTERLNPAAETAINSAKKYLFWFSMV